MLSSTNSADPESPDETFKQVYSELRNLARMRMSKEVAYSTLQGTALVHEAWLRLGGDSQPHWKSRAHFFGAAAEAMRRILVDRARKRSSQKRGGGMQRLNIEELDESERERVLEDRQLLKINDVLGKFDEVDPEKAQLVKLRYFFGMSFEEVAENMGISRSTARRWWIYARAWLAEEIATE